MAFLALIPLAEFVIGGVMAVAVGAGTTANGLKNHSTILHIAN
jgi:hypothetical protein